MLGAGLRGSTPDGAIEARNPVGVGLYDNARSAADASLPNLVPVDEDCRNWRTSIRPVNLGPIARHWQPRASYAGTYDSHWLERRAPLWPADLDLRLFSAAPPGLRAEPWLRGGEEVIIEGMHPDGAWAFRLPRREFVLQLADENRPLALDLVRIDTDTRELALVWRGAAALGARDMTELCVREAMPWESFVGEARA